LFIFKRKERSQFLPRMNSWVSLRCFYEIKTKAMEIRDIHRLRGDVSFSTYSIMSDLIVEEIEGLIKKFS